MLVTSWTFACRSAENTATRGLGIFNWFHLAWPYPSAVRTCIDLSKFELLLEAKLVLSNVRKSSEMWTHVLDRGAYSVLVQKDIMVIIKVLTPNQGDGKRSKGSVTFALTYLEQQTLAEALTEFALHQCSPAHPS
jgi:hypothetical protein